MIERISERLTAKAVENNLIDGEEREVLLFAYRQILYFVLIYAIFLAIGLVLGCFFASLVFVTLFCLLRVYAGGIHAGSYAICTVLSCGVFLLIALASLWYSARFPAVYLLALYLPCCAVVWGLAPVPDPNKPLNEKEFTHHRSTAHRLLLLETAALAAAFLLGAGNVILVFMMMAPISVAGMVLSGWVKNKRLGLC